VREDLIRAVQRGDHEAFEGLAIQISPRLCAIARLILRDEHLAEDAVQDTLVNLWRRLPTLRDTARFDAWLYRLLVNACTDIGRTRRRLSAEVRLLFPIAALADPSTDLGDREQLERAFTHLRPEQRAAVVLHFYLGFSSTEIAESLGIPVGTAKSRLHYAMEVLRAAIEADERPAHAIGGGR
jgi:RNA polymerase sigma-70 factor (ECF subfamily)